MQASVIANGLDVPPAAPALGQCWIVGATPSDAWSGQAGSLAGWTGGGWRFVAPVEGMAVWDIALGEVARYVDGAWVSGSLTGARLVIGGRQVIGPQRPAIAVPMAGSTIDSQARDAIAAILSALCAHGLIAG